MCEAPWTSHMMVKLEVAPDSQNRQKASTVISSSDFFAKHGRQGSLLLHFTQNGRAQNQILRLSSTTFGWTAECICIHSRSWTSKHFFLYCCVCHFLSLWIIKLFSTNQLSLLLSHWIMLRYFFLISWLIIISYFLSSKPDLLHRPLRFFTLLKWNTSFVGGSNPIASNTTNAFSSHALEYICRDGIVNSRHISAVRFSINLT